NPFSLVCGWRGSCPCSLWGIPRGLNPGPWQGKLGNGKGASMGRDWVGVHEVTWRRSCCCEQTAPTETRDLVLSQSRQKITTAMVSHRTSLIGEPGSRLAPYRSADLGWA